MKRSRTIFFPKIFVFAMLLSVHMSLQKKKEKGAWHDPLCPMSPPAIAQCVTFYAAPYRPSKRPPMYPACNHVSP